MGQAIVIKGADYSARNLGKVTIPYTPTTEALAFLNSIGEVVTSIKGRYISEFFDGLLSTGIYAKIQAGYMFYGATLQAVNTNFKTPTQKASLLQANIVAGGVNIGSNTEAVNLLPDVTKTPTGHICAYNKTVEGSGIKTILSCGTLQNLDGLSLSRRATASYLPLGAAFGAPVNSVTGGQDDTGTLIVTFDGTLSKLFSRGIKKKEGNAAPFAGTVGPLNLGLKAGANNYITTADISFVSIGEGLTDAEVVIYNELIETLVSGIHS